MFDILVNPKYELPNKEKERDQKMNGNQQLLRINRNVIICFVVSASLSAVVAQALAEQENYLNTTITIIFGYVIYFGIFSCLFYLILYRIPA